MLNEIEYLLTCLSEECAEIQQLCAKAQRFGLDSYHPDDPEERKNVLKLKLEINDLFGVIKHLESRGLWDGNVADEPLIMAKRKKLNIMMDISRNLGKLQ